MIPVAIDAVSGAIAAPTGGDLGGSGFAGTGTDVVAAALTTNNLRENAGFVTEFVRERGELNAWGFRKMERWGPLDLDEWMMDGWDCFGSGRKRREVVSGSVAIENDSVSEQGVVQK